MKNIITILLLLFIGTSAIAQSKIGDNPSTIDGSAILEVESSNKGVLLPKVALASETDVATITSPAVGLLVYNTGTGGLAHEGYVFWNGSAWQKFEFINAEASNTTNSTSEATITESATIGPLTFTTENLPPNDGYHKVVTSPDGKYSVRVKIETNYAFSASDLQIRSNDGRPTIMWNSGTQYVSGFVGNGNNGMTFPAEGVWYGNGGGNSTVMNSNFGQAWGDAEVYFGSPEYRRYTWTSTDTNDKNIYIFYFMLGAPSAGTIANSTNCPGGTCNTTKAYLRIEQITVE